MSDAHENEPLDSKASLGGQQELSEKPSQRPRRTVRFGLLELLLVTTVIASWLPFIFARRQIPALESEIATMRLATTQLLISDEQQLNLRKMPSIWHNIDSWKYKAPSGSDLELRLATEFINSITLPADYQSVALPVGEHTIHLKCNRDDDGHHSEVYIDDELVMQRHHPPSWVNSSGSSSSGGVSNESSAYPPSEPLQLKLQRLMVNHPLQKHKSLDIPDEYDCQGNCLWISPRTNLPEPPATFFIPVVGQQYQGVGHRQGIKVIRLNNRGYVGLLGLQPSLFATLGDERQRYPYCPLAISVRPVLHASSEPEIPEQSSSPLSPAQPGIPISFRDTIDPPGENDTSYPRESVTEDAITKDGDQMRIFAHFQPFASGAKPIVEILFDASHPDRIGFLPHAAPDSAPIQACQFVTQLDARFLWREIEMLPASDRTGEVFGTVPIDSVAQPSREPLAQLYPKLDFANLTDSNGLAIELLPWRRMPVARLPRCEATDAGLEMSRLSLITDVADTSKLTYPAGLDRKWQYTGVANRQVWRLPNSAGQDEPTISAEVRGGALFPATKIPLPGGPAIQNVRITVPMPASQPVWLEIVAEPEEK